MKKPAAKEMAPYKMTRWEAFGLVVLFCAASVFFFHVDSIESDWRQRDEIMAASKVIPIGSPVTFVGEFNGRAWDPNVPLHPNIMTNVMIGIRVKDGSIVVINSQ